tara:strand:- start:318 stop:674 length:357 start_codon:yes stop_codon:yes gene_type:complete
MAKATTTYTWNCRTVDCYPTLDGDTDVVYEIHWRYTATSSEVDSEGYPYSVTNIGVQSISTDDIKDFIPFADLDNTKMTEWTQEAMGAEQVAEIKTSIDTQLANLITPISVTLQVKAG